MRIIKTNNLGNLLGELDPATVYALTSVDEINGENSLTITTSETIDKQTRLLFMDAWGNWREYVVLGVEEQHQDADFAFNTYYAVWSMQYELSGTILKSQPGKNSPVNATAALTAALTGTRWSVGTVEPTTLAGASFYYLNAWEALGEIIKNWGGEISERLTVGDTGITSRAVDLLDRMGSDGVAGRFEFGRDVTEITRTEEDRPYYCRVIPRGQAIESDAGGYSRKVGIASVNPTGKEYLEDPETVPLVRIPIGGGQFIYPTTVVEYEEITDPQELYNRALADLHNHTRPVVSYTATVLEFENAGLTDRLQLGDTVQVVDRTFSKDGLRIEGRITRFEVDHLEHKNSRPVIGFNPSGFSGQFEAMQSSIDVLGQWRDLLQGALSADEYGNVIATADATVNGDMDVAGDASITGDLSVTGSITAAGLSIPHSRTSTVSQIATAASGFTITGASFTQWGRMATVYVTVRNTNALNAGTLYNPIATLVSGKRPLEYAPASLGTGAAIYGNAQLNTNGNIGFRPSVAINANSTITIRATFIVA